MPNIDDLNTALTNLEGNEAALITAIGTYITAVNNMINRFLARIAAGTDTAPQITRVQTLGGTINDALAQINSATAQANTEGT